MTKSFTLNLLFLLLLSLAIGSRVEAASNPIQLLIDEAKNGETIHIQGGVYKGPIVIDKTIQLIGEGEVVIDGRGEGNIITVTAPSVTIKNLTLRNGGRSATEDVAGIMLESNNNTLQHLKIEETLHGIYLKRSNQNVIENCQIQGDTELSRGRRGNGIHLFYSNHNTIKYNKIFKVRDGMYFSFSEKNYLEENQIYHNRYGLHYMYSNDNEFYRNHFYENDGGAAIMYSNNILLEENDFFNNKGLHSFGILLQSSKQIKLTKNSIFENKVGVFMDLSEGNTFKKNTIQNNNIGAEIWGSSKDNIFSENIILSNTVPIITNENDLNNNQWDYKGKGNQWGEEVQIDLNNDGIEDTPFVYTSGNSKLLTSNQLFYLFLDSPAFNVYEYLKQDATNQAILIDRYPIIVDEKKKVLLQLLPYMIIFGVVFGVFKHFKGRNVR